MGLLTTGQGASPELQVGVQRGSAQTTPQVPADCDADVLALESAFFNVCDLARRFGGNAAVDGVSFDVAAGEMVALIGPNGAGKSTTFNMLGGQLAADRGSVRFDGHDLLGLPPQRIAHLGVGRTFQIAATFASLSVAENVQTALLAHDGRLSRVWRRAMAYRRADALALLEQVEMQAQADQPCAALAYGDVKRVELAVALASSPRLLLMDEPTAGMAPAERNALMALVQRLARERDMAVLFTEHSMDVVFAYADRIVVMARGKVIAQGSADTVRNDPQVRQVYFGSGSTVAPMPETAQAQQIEPSTPDANAPGDGDRDDVAACSGQQEEYGTTSDTLANAAVAACKDNRARQTIAPFDDGVAPASAVDKEAAEGDLLLDVSDLRAWYGGAQILHDVSLTVRRGEAVALMGRNGAGKSTTLKALMGLVPRRSGNASFLGDSLMGQQPYRIARLGLGYVPEDRRVFTELTVRENLQSARQPERQWPDGQPAPAWTVERVYALFPHLAGLDDRMAGQLSGGEQQMLTVARTLMGNPFLILLDEPSEGVAPIVVEQMAAMIQTLKASGVSILLSEQNLQFAGQVCERAYVLEKGIIRHAGPMQALLRDTDLLRAYLSI